MIVINSKIKTSILDFELSTQVAVCLYIHLRKTILEILNLYSYRINIKNNVTL